MLRSGHGHASHVNPRRFNNRFTARLPTSSGVPLTLPSQSQHLFKEDFQMQLLRTFLSSALAASLLTMPLYAAPQQGQGYGDGGGQQIKHVLLISVDGLHALDLSHYVSTHPTSTLAALSAHGITYTNASTSQPSDSFPGLASIVTGGSPATAGLWYDVLTIAFFRLLHKPHRCRSRVVQAFVRVWSARPWLMTNRSTMT